MRWFKKKPKVQWYVPRWSYVTKLWRQLGSVFGLGPLVRILTVSVITSLVIVGGLKWAFPQIALPNLWRLLYLLPMMFLLFVLHFCLLTLIPPTATIRSDKIIRQHGQSAVIIDPATVTTIRLTFHPENRIRLRICYRRKSKRRVIVIGVPPTVDFDRLSEMLPMRVVVRDARDRSVDLSRKEF